MIIKLLKIAALIAIFVFVAGMGAYITLTLLIKSEDTTVIPDLAGNDIVYALEILTDLELNIKINGSEYTSDVPKNYVIFQDPGPGAEIKKGRDVRITISKGPKSVMMPNITGLLNQQAMIILEENDLVTGEISRIYSDKYARDEIVAQIPFSGKKINRKGRVSLLVSIGARPRAYMMPDLEGLSLDKAVTLIENSNLTLGAIKSVEMYGKTPDSIVRQAPLSGFRVLEGDLVNIDINRKKGGDDRSFISSPSGVRLFRYMASPGFLRTPVKIKLSYYGMLNLLYDDYLKAGDEIWTLIPKNRNATLFLYENGVLTRSITYDLWQNDEINQSSSFQLPGFPTLMPDYVIQDTE